ncbi:hypothetical protein [Salmonella enterica]|uniref:hypothetical protein n=1 Tax=Salmonella enterica TaxID=28901 RepID=UPI003F4BCE0D
MRLPPRPRAGIPTPPADPSAPQQLSNYIVGTNADGSSGTLKANNLVIGDNVKGGYRLYQLLRRIPPWWWITPSPAAISGADNITSTSVVWNAPG